ncbi:GNAT family N-acetyltransferase [Lampropedia puyangensis]|uniref:GNAT family N-acetyltransferase n=1 Tax=Lampropedia puyangensis TaxID=1330072 RepID=A0A4S8F9F5_9BURK|nr:GNAT family N-acetyltransferase [Lampropedia puyangensis]THU03651.1 GNAT family N-acetyltransferase [Lampropedia puyangensis]
MESSPNIVIRAAQEPEDMALVRELFEEYARNLPVDLDFQGFDEELANLPGEYAQPSGCVMLAFVDEQLAGCCALRPLNTSDYSNASEMKRLYVRKSFRGFGLGRTLAHAIMEGAQLAGYSCILLDTLDEMDAARALYEDLGFYEVAPYYFNPHPGAFFLKADFYG